jgi:hypothetical protein
LVWPFGGRYVINHGRYCKDYLRCIKHQNACIKIAKRWDEAKGAAGFAQGRAPHHVSEIQGQHILREQTSKIHSPELCATWLNVTFDSISSISHDITTEISSDILETSHDSFLTNAAAGAFAEVAYDNTLWLLAQESQQYSVHLKFTLFQQEK